MLPVIDLSALIAQAKMGDNCVLQTIYNAYAPIIHRYCCQRLDDDANQAARCVEEVFIHAWRGISTFQYRSDSLFAAWLYTIANQALRKRCRANFRFTHTVWPFPCTNKTGAEITEVSGRPKLLTHALNLLPMEQQHVITLKFFAGLSNSEIALALNSSEGAVKTIQHHAIDQLYQLTT